MLMASLVPYYIAFTLATCVFVYVSPGLLNPLNGIPGYQYLLICLYLLFLGVYPAYYAVTEM